MADEEDEEQITTTFTIHNIFGIEGWPSPEQRERISNMLTLLKEHMNSITLADILSRRSLQAPTRAPYMQAVQDMWEALLPTIEEFERGHTKEELLTFLSREIPDCIPRLLKIKEVLDSMETEPAKAE